MNPSMNVRVVLRIVITGGIQHREGLLGRCRIIEVDEWGPVDLLGEDGEFRPNLLKIERAHNKIESRFGQIARLIPSQR